MTKASSSYYGGGKQSVLDELVGSKRSLERRGDT